MARLGDRRGAVVRSARSPTNEKAAFQFYFGSMFVNLAEKGDHG